MVVLFGSLRPPTPFPPLLSAISAGLATDRKIEKENLQTGKGGGKGVGEELNYPIARTPDPL
jgi:hypothetical protein